MGPCGACGLEHPPGTERCPRTGDLVALGGPCGTQIDRYVVERWIGGGGMGAVYRARHAILGHAVALKLLRPRMAHDADVVQRFLREAKAAAAIGNPHIVRVLDFGVTDAPFLVMELLEGTDLLTRIETEGALAPARAIDLGLQILDGLGAAHAAGIIHRDMKPANVLLTRAPERRDGPFDFVKLVDFGISKITGGTQTSELTRTGVVLGTPYFMAPEQARGVREVDHRVDLYATAVILYQALSAALPFSGDSYEDLVIHICTGEPRPLRASAPAVPEPLVGVIERGLARDPAQRWPSAAAFADALRGASAGVLVEPPAAAPVVTAAGDGRPRGWALPVALLSLALAILGAAIAGVWIATRPAAAVTSPPAWGSPGQAGLGGVALTPVPPVVAPPPAPVVPPPAPAPEPDEDDWADMLDGIPDNDELNAMMRQAVQVAPAVMPATGVAVGEPTVTGDIPMQELLQQLRRCARPMDDCRVARPERVRVNAIIDDEGGIMVSPITGSVGDPAVTSCVGNRFQATARFGPGHGGIVQFEVALAPRP